MITGWYHRELKRRKLSSDTEPLPVSVKVLGARATAGIGQWKSLSVFVDYLLMNSNNYQEETLGEGRAYFR